MKKYKLIKEYPGSPKLGSVFTKCNTGMPLYQGKKLTDTLYETTASKFIENQPEFWEEIVEKDYEILEINGYSGRYFLNRETGYMSYGGIGDGMFKAEYYLDSSYPHYIVSVKRLSDGEIFTIGDRVDSTISDLGRATDLTGFKIIDDKLTVGLRHLGYYPLSTITLSKTLFTTEDGIDIFEGDKCVRITNHFNIINPNGEKFISKPYDGFKCFSTKEAAEEYILMNKPCLSINDVINVSYDPVETKTSTTNKLKKLVKSKL